MAFKNLFVILTAFVFAQVILAFRFTKIPTIDVKVVLPQKSISQQICGSILASALTICTPMLTHTAYAADSVPIQSGAYSQFVVNRATDSEKNRLKVNTWETWSSGDTKFKKKTYTVSEICYIDKGKFQITPNGGDPVTVQAGDFVTFPKGFQCTWDIEEPVFKHWYEF